MVDVRPMSRSSTLAPEVIQGTPGQQRPVSQPGQDRPRSQLSQGSGSGLRSRRSDPTEMMNYELGDNVEKDSSSSNELRSRPIIEHLAKIDSEGTNNFPASRLEDVKTTADEVSAPVQTSGSAPAEVIVNEMSLDISAISSVEAGASLTSTGPTPSGNNKPDSKSSVRSSSSGGTKPRSRESKSIESDRKPAPANKSQESISDSKVDVESVVSKIQDATAPISPAPVVARNPAPESFPLPKTTVPTPYRDSNAIDTNVMKDGSVDAPPLPTSSINPDGSSDEYVEDFDSVAKGEPKSSTSSLNEYGTEVFDNSEELMGSVFDQGTGDEEESVKTEASSFVKKIMSPYTGETKGLGDEGYMDDFESVGGGTTTNSAEYDEDFEKAPPSVKAASFPSDYDEEFEKDFNAQDMDSQLGSSLGIFEDTDVNSDASIDFSSVENERK